MSAYGCHNRAPFAGAVQMQDGYIDNGNGTRTPRMVTVPNNNSRECNYTQAYLGAADKRCNGCVWRKEAAC